MDTAEEVKDRNNADGYSEDEDEDDGDHIMSKGFQLESIIKENYKSDGDDQEEEEEKKEDDSFEII